jgi:hypothetical protein
MFKRYLLVAGIAVTIASSAAYAAGYFPGFPIVGGAAYCQGSSSYSTSVTVPGVAQSPTVCNDNVPLGPTVLTGNELIPADTTQNNPATVYIPMAAIGALPPAYPTFASSTAVNAFTVSPLVGKVVIIAVNNNALSNTSMQMPASPIDGQILQVSANATIATFNVSANTGQTLDTQAKTTAITVSTTGSYGYDYVFRAANSTWYRLQ